MKKARKAQALIKYIKMIKDIHQSLVEILQSHPRLYINLKLLLLGNQNRHRKKY